MFYERNCMRGFTGKLQVAFVSASLCMTAFATQWTKHPSNRVRGSRERGTCFELNVVPWGGAKYNNYFSWRSRNAIALARSEDGVKWSDPSICLEADETSGWENHVNRASVWFKDGVFHMWYTGQADGYSRIGYATSEDGVKFVRVSRMPVMIPERPHEGYSVMNPYVRWDEKRGVWRMWYAAGETFEPNVICYAESRDGIKWEKSPINPILQKGRKKSWEGDRVGGCEVHPLPDGRWAMFYIGYSNVDTAHIGCAISPDGITQWKRLRSNPIVKPTAGSWDADAVYKPSVVMDEKENRWLLWYNGRTSTREYIGMVEHAGLDLGPIEMPHNRVLKEELVRRRFDRFDFDDEELYGNAYSNRTARWTIGRHIPLFECPDEDIERTYYFRWWTYRKHLRRTASGKWVVTEFLPKVGWSGPENTIACPLGHQMREGRWIRKPEFLDDYTRFMVTKGIVNGPRSYTCWPAWGALERAKVTGNFALCEKLLGDFVKNYEAWEKGWTSRRGFYTGYVSGQGLFHQTGDREGTEHALSPDGARPMVNSAMWAEATAISCIAARKGDVALAKRFAAKADALERRIKESLWHEGKRFFTASDTNGVHSSVCELHGYAPFYFAMPLGREYAAAWEPLMSDKGFFAPVGLTFPTRDTPGFTVDPDFKKHECLWNGPSWPYATSIALTALYEALQGPDAASLPVDSGDFAKLLHQYAAQQTLVHPDGRKVPWIDENLHPFTGEWQARRIMIEQDRLGIKKMLYRERGKDYNHSTFCDLVIAGLCGIVPQEDGKLCVKPLAPKEWDWWCIDGVRYHGRDITVLFDRDGTRYGKGKGLVVIGEDEK